MDINPFRTFPDLELADPSFYTSLLDQTDQRHYRTQVIRRKPLKSLLFAFSSSLLFIFLLITLIGDHQRTNDPIDKLSISSIKPEVITPILPRPRGVSEGLSDKTFRDVKGNGETFAWTKTMLSWQRTAYHYQPQKNWMNGPLFHKGWYHLFYQYNPDAAVWGNITWGHTVSTDLIHWLDLPMTMVPDHWYDINGVWTGSATLLPDGSIVMIYTGSTNESVQVQNVAYPANISDPLLLDWVKYSGNPVLVPPPGIGLKDFRDPTTAWYVPNKWRITLGSKVNTTGISLVYETTDFINYTLLDGILHSVPHTGEWECIDLYPVSVTEENGLDTSVNGPGVKHVLKASIDDNKHDYYALGVYNSTSDTWTPDDPELDVGIGMRYDYGKFYASKTFYDQNKGRRILWGWIGETDAETTDIAKGWSGLQGVPRTVLFDKKTKSNVLQWPVVEVESLRLGSSKEFDEIEIASGSVVPLDVGAATQLDINAEFKIDGNVLEGINEADVGYNCSTSGGSQGRGILGPFGLLVLADDGLSEQTAVYFYVGKATDGNIKTFFCTDESRHVFSLPLPLMSVNKFTGVTFPYLMEKIFP
ncbi:hypothetical protein GIB67_038041 [Kingdonia uniflora]|uniref:Beta-fructofuranosidase n=1 Tax=Kingdonia uniflora TaxID=39325 RepID=A0A7J7MCF3_9MAGN|nr:hypothetical protein GIB67_038041 [Kingdonia uniflora]